MNKKRLRKYLKKLAEETDFWFDIELASDKTNVELTIHGDNPEGEDWQWSFSVKNSNKEKKFLEAISIEIKNAYDNFDIEENVELMLEAKRNGCQGIPNVVDLVANEQYKMNALREFGFKLQACKIKEELLKGGK